MNMHPIRKLMKTKIIVRHPQEECHHHAKMNPCKKISGIPSRIGGIPGGRLGISGGRLGIPGGIGRIPGGELGIPGRTHQPRWSAPDSL